MISLINLRPLFRWAAYALLAVLLLIGAGAWWAGSAAAVRWVAANAAGWSGGRIQIQQVEGSLYGPLAIGELIYAADGQRVRAQAIKFDWRMGDLLRAHLNVPTFSMQSLDVHLAEQPSSAPLSLPSTLRLPFTFALHSNIQHITIHQGASTQRLQGLALELTHDARQYALKLQPLGTPWGAVAAEVRLDDLPPFHLRATISGKGLAALPYQFTSRADGTLSQVKLDGDMTLAGGSAQFNAQLAPFAAMPFTAATLAAQNINPQQWDKTLPLGKLNGKVQVTATAALQPPSFQATLQLHNSLAGAWDQGKLPFAQLDVNLHGNPESFTLDNVILNLAQAGVFRGQGAGSATAIDLRLRTQDFNPQGVHSKAEALKLAGAVALSANSDKQSVDLNLAASGYKLALTAHHQDDTLFLREATLTAQSSRLVANGQLSLAKLQAFSAHGKLTAFNPADFGDFPRAHINAQLDAAGNLSPKPEAQLHFAITDSQLRQQPLSGKGTITASATRVLNSDLALQWGRNRLTAEGSFGAPDDRLQVQMNVPQLPLLHPDLSGAITAEATLQGSFAAPFGSFTINGHKLDWQKKYRLDTLTASGSAAQDWAGKLALNVLGAGGRTPFAEVDQLALTLAGTRDQHQINLSANHATMALAAEIHAAWRKTGVWAGDLRSLTHRGDYPLVLHNQPTFVIGDGSVLVNQANVSLDTARIRLDSFSLNDGKIASQGGFDHFPVRVLEPFSHGMLSPKTDLTLHGDWQWQMGEQVNGQINVAREAGDVVLSSPSTALGIRDLSLNLTAAQNVLAGKLNINGEQLGMLNAQGSTTLTQRDGNWGMAGETPLQAKVNLDMPSLQWLQPIVDASGGTAVNGQLLAELAADGTVAKPNLLGSIRGQNLRYAIAEQGIDINDGSLAAEWHDNVLQINPLVLSAGKGKLTGQGTLTLTDTAPAMQWTFVADQFKLLSRPDRLIILSGDGTMTLREKTLVFAAKLKADQGLIEWADNDIPQPSDDVVIVGEAPKAAASASTRFDYDVRFALGDKFYFKGQGLDAKLGGDLRLRQQDGRVIAGGSVRVDKGDYSAYGQKLSIERGVVNFQGPLDNPGLDIIALRKNLAVEAGVSVQGTAQVPKVQLVSTPAVPDSEKLSWLVLGHGLDSSSGEEVSALQTAANLLLSAGESVTLQRNIALATGLDEVSLNANSDQGSVITLGKRLSPRTYLSYVKSLNGVDTLVKITYALSKRLSLQAQGGSTGAVDLFYTFPFD